MWNLAQRDKRNHLRLKQLSKPFPDHLQEKIHHRSNVEIAASSYVVIDVLICGFGPKAAGYCPGRIGRKLSGQ
jgi:hypothetical protein